MLSTSFVEGAAGSTLKFVLAETALDGGWLGYQNLT